MEQEEGRSAGPESGPEPAGASPLTAAEDVAILSALRVGEGQRPRAGFRLTRWVYLRALGFCYVVAFAVLYNQVLPLIGTHGLLPADAYLTRTRRFVLFSEHPTLFWFGLSDAALQTWAGAGLLLSLLVLAGVDHALIMFTLWAVYLSFVHVGQLFYGYGWETLLLEAGSLAVFLAPMTQLRSARDPRPVPAIMHVWLCWLTFRLMFGAGMIKLRGDPCWRDLTCLYYHYETQPVPHALSRLLHWAPRWFHQGGVLFNHFVEVVAPWGLFVPRLRHAAVAAIVAFQTILILSGNLSFLNWLSIAVALGCVDDRVWNGLLPGRVRAHIRRDVQEPSRARLGAVIAYSCIAGLLSVSPALNMLSPNQQMNTSFEPLHLINSYGAFGSIDRERDQVILEGTSDSQLTAATRWQPYELKCQPGDVNRMPCWITPYHYRLDWQMWFASLSEAAHEPWLVHFVYKLLHNDAAALSLLAKSPFRGEPPRYVRAERYRYHFTRIGSQAYWERERIGAYLPALSLTDPRLLSYLADHGLIPGESVDLSR